MKDVINVVNNTITKSDISNFKLTEKESDLLKNTLKRGIYLHLYHKELINENQLHILVNNTYKSLN